MRSVHDESVPDLVADDAQQQQGGQEGVEQQEVLRVPGQGARVALLDDLVAVGDEAGSRQRRRGVCTNRDTQKESGRFFFINVCISIVYFEYI